MAEIPKTDEQKASKSRHERSDTDPFYESNCTLYVGDLPADVKEEDFVCFCIFTFDKSIN